jgi:hypothetical protein
VRRSRLRHHQHVALVHRFAGGEEQLAHLAARHGAQLMLHLHGFQDRDHVAGANGVARADQPLHQLSLERSAQF